MLSRPLRFASTSVLLLLPWLALPTTALQNGDRPGEEQPDVPAELEIPPAPVLSPAQALASFQLPPGYRIELVAAEPLVEDPVCGFFDLDGRLWLAEMRGYMPNVDGTGEDVENGVICVLEDTDGDGAMDTRTEFLSGLVLPRAIAPGPGGSLLVISPPELFLARDTDGDGVADERETLMQGLGGLHSPEHAINGLMHGIDNWIEVANQGLRFRFENGLFVQQKKSSGGQWGLTRDDVGRLFYNTNSDPLRGDPYSAYYSARNRNIGLAKGVNVRIANDMTTWPARITPGVNRGYRPATLRDDYTLARFTGACGPLIYRGDAMPELSGDAFVAEPCGNLIKRYSMREDENGRPVAEQAYVGSEFLASTDERFRPVNLIDGPDGALYVIDLYRGILQHRMFVTSFLRRQILARGLDKPLGLGRIWRVVKEDGQGLGGGPLSSASWTELVGALEHPNGWWRDTAQRILVEEGGGDAIQLCEALLITSPEPLARVHALWSLSGLNALAEEHVLVGLSHPDARVRQAALRVSEPLLFGTGARAARLARLIDAGWDAAGAAERRQILLSLGEGRGLPSDEVLATRLAEVASSDELRQCTLSGLFERELDFLVHLLSHPAWQTVEGGRGATLRLLARCIAREGRSERIEGVIDALAQMGADDARQAPIIDGLLAGRPKGPDGKETYLPVARRPLRLDEVGHDGLANALLWPGRVVADRALVRALTAEEQARFLRGRELFTLNCATCHQASGQGEPGKAPRLRFSPWVLESERRLARVVMGGMQGELRMDGTTWNMEMPAWTASDEDTAALLTYLRREWGHGAEPVTPATIAGLRPEIEARAGLWNASEVERLTD